MKTFLFVIFAATATSGCLSPAQIESQRISAYANFNANVETAVKRVCDPARNPPFKRFEPGDDGLQPGAALVRCIDRQGRNTTLFFDSGGNLTGTVSR